jgi:hypothetical protein
MRKTINRIKDWLEDKLRGICSPMSPGRRVITIVTLIVVFAAVNFYVTFRAIYNIGREDARREVIEITPLNVPDFESQDKEPTLLQKEMEDFFKQNFNSEQDDTTTEE